MRMISLWRSGIFRACMLCLMVAGVTSCQKEKSFEQGSNSGNGSAQGGSAVFELVAAGANCSDAVVAGTYQAGTTIGTDAQITLTVNVTTIGDWSYTTGMVNGYIFAGAGNFTTTGNQSITLLGAGKPVTAGNDNIPLNIGGATCSTTVTVIAASTPVTNETYYYKATIDGANYTQTVTATNNFIAGSSLDGVDDVAIGASIEYDGTTLPLGSTSMGIEKGLMHNYLTATNANFKAFFPVGDVAYAKAAVPSYSNGDGIVIGWTDQAGASWDTQSGTGDQTGSTFKIISVTEATDPTGIYYLTVKMQFTCKLYNHTTGAVKQLTNGEMVGIFAKI